MRFVSKVFGGARDLKLGLHLHQLHLFMSSKVFGETVLMCRFSLSDSYLISTNIPCIDHVIVSNKATC